MANLVYPDRGYDEREETEVHDFRDDNVFPCPRIRNCDYLARLVDGGSVDADDAARYEQDTYLADPQSCCQNRRD